jgi:hypothetical protein
MRPEPGQAPLGLAQLRRMDPVTCYSARSTIFRTGRLLAPSMPVVSSTITRPAMPTGTAPRGRAAWSSAVAQRDGGPAADHRQPASLFPPPCRSEPGQKAPAPPLGLGLPEFLGGVLRFLGLPARLFRRLFGRVRPLPDRL